MVEEGKRRICYNDHFRFCSRSFYIFISYKNIIYSTFISDKVNKWETVLLFRANPGTPTTQAPNFAKNRR